MVLSLKRIADDLYVLILNPKKFWKQQKHDNGVHYKLIAVYFFPLLLCVTLAVFIGEFLRSNNLYAGFALLKSLRKIILFTSYYFLSVFFTNELMKIFGAEKNKQVARKLIVFSLTPFLLVSIITGLFPFLYVLDVIFLYGFYIFWIGAGELVALPESKLYKYIVVNITVCFTLFSFLSVFFSKLLNLYF
jgi:hypothetical protein